MSYNLRKSLYAKTALRVCYNPTKAVSEEYDVIDLTVDVSNQTYISHTNTDDVRELLGSTQIVVCDNPRLANTISKLPNTLVASIPYGRVNAARTSRIGGRELRIGLLNHSTPYATALTPYYTLLNKLQIPFLMYGNVIEDWNFDVPPQIMDDFEVFTASVDIVLIPTKPEVVLSPTEIIALAGSGVVVVATKTSLFGEMFSKPAGIMLMKKATVGSVRKTLKLFDNDNALAVGTESNRIFVNDLLIRGQKMADKVEARIQATK